MNFFGLTDAIDDAVAGGRNACRAAVRRDLTYQRLSAAAYQSEEAARLNALAAGFRLVEHVHDARTGADAMLFVNDAFVVVAFRGTQRNYADIVTDLKFRTRAMMSPASGSPVIVHRGFLDQWAAIRERIVGNVQALATPGRRIVVTGHSLGGALAVLAALSWRGFADELVTFGAPRVGNASIREAAQLNNVRHRRYVYGADVVPIVPLLAMGYRHGCRPIYLTRGGRAIDDCPLWRELIGRTRSLLTVKWSKSWSWCPVPTRVFTDHRLGGYGAAMRRAA